MSGFFDAVSLLTRVPTRGGADPGRAIPWMPVVGALVGGAVGGTYTGLHGVVTPFVAASLAIGMGIVLTGALHEDGLADTADAFGARVDRARTIEILQDPRHGTYGVLALLVSVVVRIGAVASMGPPTAVAALVAAHSLSRAGAAGTMASMPAATSSTLGASYKQSSPRTWIAVAISLAIAALTLGIWSIPAAAIVLGVVIAAGTISMKKIGGFSGDVLGTVQQLSEIGILVLAVAVRNAVPWWHA